MAVRNIIIQNEYGDNLYPKTNAEIVKYNNTESGFNRNDVQGAIDSILDKSIDYYIEDGNCIDNKYVSKSGDQMLVIDNNDYCYAVFPYTTSQILRWYAGSNSAFTQTPKPQLVVFKSGVIKDTRNYYANSTDESGNKYQEVNALILKNADTMYVSFKKSGVCKITDNSGNVLFEPTFDRKEFFMSSEKCLNPDTLESVQLQINSMKIVPATNETKLFLGSLLNGTPTNTGSISSSSTSVCMESLISVPFMNATLKFYLPYGILANVRSGNCGKAVNTSQPNLEEDIANGETFTFGNNDLLFRIYFTKSGGGNVTAQEIQNYIDNGSLYVTYNEHCPVLSAQSQCDRYAKAIMFKFHPGFGNDGQNMLGNIPLFAHISDIHGDAVRLERFMEYCDSLELDCAINTGDTCSQNAQNGMKFNEDIANSHKTLLFTCVGNHDTYNNTTVKGQYDDVMSYQYEERYGVVTGGEEDYPTYFYKDFTTKKIRLIALNQWTGKGGSSPYFEYMSQEQIDFLLDALLNCPEDYGVMIMCHNTENTITMDNNYAKFYQYPNYCISITRMTNSNGDATTPISDIIDAYIDKGTINKSYIARQNNTDLNLQVTADFSNAEGEFVCWIVGHNHQDFIGYNGGSQKMQLVLGVCSGNAIYGMGVADNDTCEGEDIPRGGHGATQDAFNIYAVDFDNKEVKVARIGSNMTYQLQVRDVMSIPYQTT